MGKVFVTESYLDDIADAIRGKNGTENTYKPSQMAAAITALPDPAVLDDKTITANGTYDPSDDDLDGYSEVTVNVPNSYAAGDEGKVVSNGVLVTQGSDTVTENDTYDTTLISSLTVNVSGGGGGDIPLLSRSEWNALTKQQKLSYGLVAIQDSITGYIRGVLVSGEDYSTYQAAEIVPKDSWNASTNTKNTYIFTGTTNANEQTTTCLAITSQNGSNPSSESPLTTLREGTSGNGIYKVFYGYFSNNVYADTYSGGNNWNNSEIVCFEFSGEPELTIKELFYEQGQNGTYTYTYQPTEEENLFLVFLRGGNSGNAVSITGLTQKSYVTSSGARINGVYYDTVNSEDTINISIPYASGTNSNGSLLVVLFSIE